jgi:N-acetylmuramate 1-kinase
VQRHLKVAGIFARLYHRDGKPGYLNDIPLTLDYLITVADSYAELEDLCDLLEQLEIAPRLLERNREIVQESGVET